MAWPRWSLVLVIVVGAVVRAPTARADDVDVAARELRDGNLRQRARAVARLAKGADPRVTRACARAATADDSTLVRRECVRVLQRRALAKTTAREKALARHALRRVARSDPDERVRRSATRALRRLGERMRRRPPPRVAPAPMPAPGPVTCGPGPAIQGCTPAALAAPAPTTTSRGDAQTDAR